MIVATIVAATVMVLAGVSAGSWVATKAVGSDNSEEDALVVAVLIAAFGCAAATATVYFGFKYGGIK